MFAMVWTMEPKTLLRRWAQPPHRKNYEVVLPCPQAQSGFNQKLCLSLLAVLVPILFPDFRRHLVVATKAALSPAQAIGRSFIPPLTRSQRFTFKCLHPSVPKLSAYTPPHPRVLQIHRASADHLNPDPFPRALTRDGTTRSDHPCIVTGFAEERDWRSRLDNHFSPH